MDDGLGGHQGVGGGGEEGREEGRVGTRGKIGRGGERVEGGGLGRVEFEAVAVAAAGDMGVGASCAA